MWERIERILAQIKYGRYLRKAMRHARRSEGKLSVCDELGYCPFTDAERCKDCPEEGEVWE